VHAQNGRPGGRLVSAGARRWIVMYVALAAAFLATVATYYHPRYGFTQFIEFPGSEHYSELPVVRGLPHFHNPTSTGYDGQFYAQLSIEPLLRDPAVDYAMDLAPYRARRIFFSWTAYVLGLGRPAWILQAYSLENVASWLLLAWLLCRWMPPTSGRRFVLWAGCLLSHGLLVSVRLALPDGPSVLLIALAVAAAEQGRPFLSALILGVAGLGRETNLLAAALFVRFARGNVRSWLLILACLLLCVLPLALWIDYLRSIYHWRTLSAAGNITTPLAGLMWKLRATSLEFAAGGWTEPMIVTILALAAFFVQGAFVVWALVTGRDRSPWALVAASFLLLALFMHRVVWQGAPGAFTRVVLPLAIGANVLIARLPKPPWWLILSANLGAIPGVMLFVLH
jgi:hypothetical protein